MEFIKHPLIKKDKVSVRRYQENVVSRAIEKSTLVVLPTGLGKTIIALMIAAHKLTENPDKKILFLAPTKPLVVQHYDTFKTLMNVEELVFLTGQTKLEDRIRLIEENKIIFSTPQTIDNQILRGLDLSQFSLIIFDEAHKAVGSYSYVEIAREYHQKTEKPHVLALTASPGKDREKIRHVCQNLGVQIVEAKTEKDKDVAAHVQKTNVEWKSVELPKEFIQIKKNLESILKDQLTLLKSSGYLDTASISKANKKTLLTAQTLIRKELITGGGNFTASSYIASAIKINHAIELIETQGLKALRQYFERMLKQKSKAVKKISQDHRFLKAHALTQTYIEAEIEHPKIEALADLTERYKGRKVLVFTQFRDSVDAIINQLNKRDILAHEFIGQQSKGTKKGMSQKKQIEVLENFRNNAYTALVATSVAEEGLDIPKVDLVIFYEPVPSEIRSIQRRGRTGRTESGRVVVLMTKKTRDEAYYWAARHKEKKMRETVKSLKNGFEEQVTLTKFEQEKKTEKKQIDKQIKETIKTEDQVLIYIDQRERNTQLLRTIKNLAKIELKTLNVGDFICSNRVVVERKTVDDFLQSIIDKRLMNQIREMKRNFEKPILIIEGINYYTRREIHPNAIRGMLSSIAIDYNIPIIPSENEQDTAYLIYHFAKREQIDEKRAISLRGGKKPKNIKEKQLYLIESLPNVSAILADRILNEFKTIEKIAKTKTEKLTKIEGLGKKKAEKIREVFTSHYNE